MQQLMLKIFLLFLCWYNLEKYLVDSYFILWVYRQILNQNSICVYPDYSNKANQCNKCKISICLNLRSFLSMPNFSDCCWCLRKYTGLWSIFCFRNRSIKLLLVCNGLQPYSSPVSILLIYKTIFITFLAFSLLILQSRSKP